MDTPLIHVTGDHIVHWLQQVGSAETTANQGSRGAWDRATFFRLQARPWGAALIAEILREAAEARREDDRAVYGFRVTGNTLRQSGVGNTENRNVARDFSMWREDKHGIWRMHQFLLRAQASDAPFYPDGKPDYAPACLIIDDAEGRFRTHFRESLEWFESPDLCPKSVILKTISPLPESSGAAANRPIPLWDYLRGRYAEILTVYCKVDNLRESGFGSVGRSLSWEQIALDVLDAINAPACDLKAAQRVVVSLGLEGAVVTERGEDGRHGGVLIFDPNNQEGDRARTSDGVPVGVGRYVVASMAMGTVFPAQAPQRPWVESVKLGLMASRVTHDEGFSDSRPVRLKFTNPSAIRWIADQDEAGRTPFRDRDIQAVPTWRLLQPESAGDYLEEARTLAVEGRITGKPFPTEHMGNWSSVDRTEIESMRTVRNLIREYLAQPAQLAPPPLNLAVFGQPGAGKSFAVKELVKHLNEKELARDAKLHFWPINLAQLATTSALATAFHGIRDWVVRGETPVVFWDEFDSTVDRTPLGWLAPFLAPMQDGEFSDGDTMRPIGRAVFIFAGGVFRTANEFQAQANILAERERYTAESGERQAAGGRAPTTPTKAIDFVSRLRGFVDILGPNRVESRATPGDPQAGTPAPAADAAYILRRAILLRGVLQKNAKWLFKRERGANRLQIDAQVLDAFLTVEAYEHGTRSMEALVQMSALAGKDSFQRSAIPPQHQLDLHLGKHAGQFLCIVERGLTAAECAAS